ncbi:hypothetical protein ACFWIA_12635 [Streptomyces sp. NPDC127068]|uniref:hypothetical protein n=1 Tax=Streptomyces sp. NPDC127068 TaxID=3347127 RepID=UPI0036602A68
MTQDSTSSAVQVTLSAAVQRASHGNWPNGHYRVFCTHQANSCVLKSIRVAGLGAPTVVDTTSGTARMDPGALAARDVLWVTDHRALTQAMGPVRR